MKKNSGPPAIASESLHHRGEALRAGQTLLEATIALAALLIIVTATTSAIAAALSNALFTKNQNVAGKLAQEGMEYIRNLKTNNYAYFQTLSAGSPTKYCLNTLPASPPLTGFSPSCTPALVNNTFLRTVTVEELDADTATECSFSGAAGDLAGITVHSVVVEVAWSSGKCAGGAQCHKSTVKSCFINN